MTNYLSKEKFTSTTIHEVNERLRLKHQRRSREFQHGLGEIDSKGNGWKRRSVKKKMNCYRKNIFNLDRTTAT